MPYAAHPAEDCDAAYELYTEHGLLPPDDMRALTVMSLEQLTQLRRQAAQLTTQRGRLVWLAVVLECRLRRDSIRQAQQALRSYQAERGTHPDDPEFAVLLKRVERRVIARVQGYHDFHSPRPVIALAGPPPVLNGAVRS